MGIENARFSLGCFVQYKPYTPPGGVLPPAGGAKTNKTGNITFGGMIT
jgi:hypothetical protein